MPNISIFENPEEKLAVYLAKKGMKLTNQRRLIVSTFCDHASEHLSAEELYQKLRVIDPSIGQATVYRTLKLMLDAGLARELHFGDDVARFEPYASDHHDHLICEECGKTVPVFDEKIESLQANLAAQHGFKPTSHRMYLFGICKECLSK